MDGKWNIEPKLTWISSRRQRDCEDRVELLRQLTDLLAVTVCSLIINFLSAQFAEGAETSVSGGCSVGHQETVDAPAREATTRAGHETSRHFSLCLEVRRCGTGRKLTDSEDRHNAYILSDRVVTYSCRRFVQGQINHSGAPYQRTSS